jgi:hypothetical protein
VNRRVTAARLLTLLCLMALLVVQATGGIHAYLCDCGGQTRWTKVDHCHGPHSIGCHAEDFDVPHQEHGDPGDRHEHEQIAQELLLRSVEGLQVPALIPVLLTWMPDVSKWQEASAVVRQLLVEPEASPPPGVAVARTVVFLI